MKGKLAVAVVVLQLLVLAFMAGQREWIARTGTPLVLRTAPVDPNDPMRGAYIRLNYEISFVPAALCRGEVAQWTKANDYRKQQKVRDRIVYAWLQPNEYGISELISLADQPPEHDGVPFIKGRVQSADLRGVQVRYGIEAHFMSKEAAQRTERGGTEKAGAPMNVTVAVGGSGTAMLRSTAWEPLGLTFTIDRPPESQRLPAGRPVPRQPRALTGMNVILHNYGDQDVAIVNLPDGQSFRLIPNLRWTKNEYDWAGAKSDHPPAPTAADILVLKPGAQHAIHLDLTSGRWRVIDTRKPGSAPMPLQDIPPQEAWSASFRLEYAPPPAAAVRGLPNAGLVRHAPLRSRAFNANQGVD